MISKYAFHVRCVRNLIGRKFGQYKQKMFCRNLDIEMLMRSFSEKETDRILQRTARISGVHMDSGDFDSHLDWELDVRPCLITEKQIVEDVVQSFACPQEQFKHYIQT